MPTLVSEIVRLGHSQEMIDLARSKGAKGIQFYGICCTGLSAMYRYDNVIPLCNLLRAEHIAYDHTHSNIGETTEMARKIVRRGIESYEARQGIPVFIPPYEVEAELGFSVESVTKDLNSLWCGRPYRPSSERSLICSIQSGMGK